MRYFSGVLMLLTIALAARWLYVESQLEANLASCMRFNNDLERYIDYRLSEPPAPVTTIGEWLEQHK